MLNEPSMIELFFYFLAIFMAVSSIAIVAFLMVYCFGGKKIRKQIREDW